MENEIEEKRTNIIVPEGTEMNYIVASKEQPAIGHADEVKNRWITKNYMLGGMESGKQKIGHDYYNLFIGYDPFEKGHFTVTFDRVLREYISDEMKERFSHLTPEIVAEIKQRPAFITEECDQRSAKDRQGVLAIIKDIQKRENGYEIYFQSYYPVSLELIWEYRFDLGIAHPFEMTRTHWTVKQIDLMEVLEDIGASPFSKGAH